MATTLTACSWLLVALSVCVTAWLYPHPLAFLPWGVLAFAITTASCLATRAFFLVLALLSMSVSFWSCWDVAFIHPSTLNFTPCVVASVEALLGGVACLVVYRI